MVHSRVSTASAILHEEIAIIVAFTRLNLSRQFLVASFPILIAGMLVIGAWAGQTIERGVVNRMGGVTSLYADSFVAPRLQHLLNTGVLDEAHRSAFDALLADAIFSEETADSPTRLANTRVWIVDPLDGTSNFIARGDEFSVSIGLAVAAKPAVGVVYNPTRGELYAGGAGLGVTLNGIATRVSDTGDIASARLSVSRKELAALNGLLPCRELVPISSMAYKLARVAAGMEDGVLSKKRRKEWGSCAGTALVLAAGGRVFLLDGVEIRFNRAGPLQALGMVAAGPVLHSLLLAALRPLLAARE